MLTYQNQKSNELFFIYLTLCSYIANDKSMIMSLVSLEGMMVIIMIRKKRFNIINARSNITFILYIFVISILRTYTILCINILITERLLYTVYSFEFWIRYIKIFKKNSPIRVSNELPDESPCIPIIYNIFILVILY